MADDYTPLAANDMNTAVKGARRDASPAGLEQDKRKRKIGVSIHSVVMCVVLMIDKESLSV